MSETSQLKSIFLPAQIDACALWRMYIPHVNTPRSMYYYREGHVDRQRISAHDVALVQRLYSEGNVMAMDVIHEVGAKIIYDLDDNLWAVPHYNPAYSLFKDAKEQFVRCVEKADVITVSTRRLSTAVKSAIPSISKPVLVIPNSYDPKMMYPARINKNDNRIVVGWGGSNTHSLDVKEVWGLLDELLEKHSNLYFEFVGGNLPLWLRKHERVTIKEWVPVSEYFAQFASWGWDIALAPLENNRFNASKSNIKMLEAASIGIPCLVSDVDPYSSFCELGRGLRDALVCKSSTDWLFKLEAFINSATYRREVAVEMHRVASEFFCIEHVKNNWSHAMSIAKGS